MRVVVLGDLFRHGTVPRSGRPRPCARYSRKRGSITKRNINWSAFVWTDRRNERELSADSVRWRCARVPTQVMEPVPCL